MRPFLDHATEVTAALQPVLVCCGCDNDLHGQAFPLLLDIPVWFVALSYASSLSVPYQHSTVDTASCIQMTFRTVEFRLNCV